MCISLESLPGDDLASAIGYTCRIFAPSAQEFHAFASLITSGDLETSSGVVLSLTASMGLLRIEKTTAYTDDFVPDRASSSSFSGVSATHLMR